MKKLIFAEQEFEAERIEKTVDSIIGYTSNKVIFEFRGISDFSVFNLEDAQEWDIPHLSNKERIAELEQIINMMLMGEM